VDLRRLRHGEWIAGVSGAVLLVSLFLDWYTVNLRDGVLVGDKSANAWEAFTVIDVILAAAALFGIALAVGAATQRSPAVPQAIGALTVPVAFVAAVLVVIRLIDLPSFGSVSQVELSLFNFGDGGPEVLRAPGLIIGVMATLGVLVGAWRSIGDQSFPRAVAPKVDVTPLPAPKVRSEPSASGDEG
jgi:hypothetical protein